MTRAIPLDEVAELLGVLKEVERTLDRSDSACDGLIEHDNAMTCWERVGLLPDLCRRQRAEIERLTAQLAKYEQPDDGEAVTVECPDCSRDRGHGYCGTCGGTGKVRRDAALKGEP